MARNKTIVNLELIREISNNNSKQDYFYLSILNLGGYHVYYKRNKKERDHNWYCGE